MLAAAQQPGVRPCSLCGAAAELDPVLEASTTASGEMARVGQSAVCDAMSRSVSSTVPRYHQKIQSQYTESCSCSGIS
ncbi:hypothetical protein [Streptomyces achromogenes]|uniref:hypothetical protein n=1 Tax=Streptomyces achromogenes TaxID=67255 RepID=UPI003158347E